MEADFETSVGPEEKRETRGPNNQPGNLKPGNRVDHHSPFEDLYAKRQKAEAKKKKRDSKYWWMWLLGGGDQYRRGPFGRWQRIRKARSLRARRRQAAARKALLAKNPPHPAKTGAIHPHENAMQRNLHEMKQALRENKAIGARGWRLKAFAGNVLGVLTFGLFGRGLRAEAAAIKESRQVARRLGGTWYRRGIIPKLERFLARTGNKYMGYDLGAIGIGTKADVKSLESKIRGMKARGMLGDAPVNTKMDNLRAAYVAHLETSGLKALGEGLKPGTAEAALYAKRMPEYKKAWMQANGMSRLGVWGRRLIGYPLGILGSLSARRQAGKTVKSIERELGLRKSRLGTALEKVQGGWNKVQGLWYKATGRTGKGGGRKGRGGKTAPAVEPEVKPAHAQPKGGVAPSEAMLKGNTLSGAKAAKVSTAGSQFAGFARNATKRLLWGAGATAAVAGGLAATGLVAAASAVAAPILIAGAVIGVGYLGVRTVMAGYSAYHASGGSVLSAGWGATKELGSEAVMMVPGADAVKRGIEGEGAKAVLTSVGTDAIALTSNAGAAGMMLYEAGVLVGDKQVQSALTTGVNAVMGTGETAAAAMGDPLQAAAMEMKEQAAKTALAAKTPAMDTAGQMPKMPLHGNHREVLLTGLAQSNVGNIDPTITAVQNGGTVGTPATPKGDGKGYGLLNQEIAAATMEPRPDGKMSQKDLEKLHAKNMAHGMIPVLNNDH